MPIEILKSNLYRIRELSVGCDSVGYYLSMNPGHASACVLCISKDRPISIDDLNLTNEGLQMLYSGRKLDFTEKGYILQGITKHQITTVSQFRNFTLEPPAYVQVWGMDSAFRGVTLYVPENPNDQMKLVPVIYQADVGQTTVGNTSFFKLKVTLNRDAGYQDGDLLYQVDDHFPIPIPKSVLGYDIIVRETGSWLRVISADPDSQRYAPKT